MLIQGLDRYILREPPSCPHRCPYEDVCDSDNTGICLLDDGAEAERSARADVAFEAARETQLQGGIS